MNSISNFKYIIILISSILWGAFFYACNDDDDVPVAQVVWDITLNSKFENPAVSGRNETGTLEMVLYSDHSLWYSFRVNNLNTGDALTAAHIHAGDPLTNGSVLLNFNPSFSNNTATGTLYPRESFVDSLLDTSVELYFNVHSQQVPAGLLRGQVNSDILLTADIPLAGANEFPPVQTTATGSAYLRLATNKKLYARVDVANLEPGDAWTAAHIHPGAPGVNGSVLIGLCANANDFGVKQIISLTTDNINSLLNDSTYVNAHTTLHGPGAIRGQVRNRSNFHPH